MFYIVDQNNELVRQGEKKNSLRRIRRKSPNIKDLRIIEGSTVKKALENEAKATGKGVTLTNATTEKVVKKMKRKIKANLKKAKGEATKKKRTKKTK